MANKPILFYGLEAIADAGIKDVGIVVGDTAAEVQAAVGDGSSWGLTVTYLRQEAPLGLAHAVLIARDFLGSDDFVMYLGDNLLEQRLKDLVARFEADREQARTPTLGGEPRREPRAPRSCSRRFPTRTRFGVAELDQDGSVVRLVEKPEPTPRPNLALVGRVHVRCPGARSGGGDQAVRAGGARDHRRHSVAGRPGSRVRTEILEGWWIDTGKLTPLLDANRLILETLDRRIDGEVDDESELDGRVVLEAGARVVRSRIRGPVDHRRRHRLHRRVRRTLLRHRPALRDRSQRDRALGDPRRLPGARGRAPRGLSARPSRRGDPDPTRRPRATRLMVGDHSQIDLD